MRLRSLNLLLLASMVVAGFLNWIIRPDSSRPNFEFLPDMAHSVPYDSFSANPNLPDGKTLRQPVPGTIPRGFMPVYYEATPEDALRAGDELQNPYSIDETASLERGAFVFASFCRHCHGAGGRGDGAVVLRGYPGPPNYSADEAVNKKDGHLFHIISYGQGNMPAHASQISREDRWKVILYIRTLQAESRPAEGSPESQAGN